VQGMTTDSQSKRMSGRADTMAEVMQSPLINGIKADIVRLQSKLADSNITLGKNHPQTLRAESELAALRDLLVVETQKITTSIETTYQVSKQREQQLLGTLANQKARVLLLNKQRDELNVMRRDIESAQHTFELMSQRASQANIESRANLTNISVLNPAVAAQAPSKPQVLLNLMVSVILGALLGMLAALVMELTHRRVRSVEDLLEVLDIPILGSVSSAAALFDRTKPKAIT
jgi:succinoglycan biosynthesis transport protein ExoP